MPAFNADGSKIGGSVNFRRETVAEGQVQFTHASVAHNFEWRDVKSPDKAILDLRFTKVGTLFNDPDPKRRPNQGQLFLNGFDYDEIEQQAYPNARV